MQKYISQSVYADNLKECIYGFLEDSRNITKSSTVFWSFLETIEFAFGKISRDCYFFRQMKEYADEHPITKTSLIWQIHFENADENSVKNAILQLVKEREKNIKFEPSLESVGKESSSRQGNRQPAAAKHDH